MKKILKIITKNLWVKLFCLIAASLLWVYVAAGQNSVGKFPGDIQIKAVNVPSGLVAVYSDNTVQIKIMADAPTWRRLSADTFTAYVDLSAYSAGTYELPVNISSSISGVQIVEKTPSTIFVTLEPIIQKEVQVEKKIEGSAAEGFVAGDVVFDPAKVTVTGPKSVVDSLTTAVAEIKLNNESQNFTKSVPLIAYNGVGDQINEISFLPETVAAKVSIIKGTNSKTVGVKVASSGQPQEGFFVSAVSVSPSTVDITGAPSALADVTFLTTTNVDISNIAADTDRDANLVLPSGITLQKGSPSRVKIKFKVQNSEISREVTVSISTKNLSGYSVASYSPSQVKVTVSGPANIIGNIKSGDVVMILDFSGKTLSDDVSFSLSTSSFSVPDGVFVLSFAPSSVSVSLTKNE